MSSLRQRTAASAEVDASPSSSSSPAKLTSNGDTFIDAIFASLFQPGLNAPLHNLMNYTFYALFLTLSVMIFLTSANIHVIALFGIALGLFASVNWFLAELKKLPPSTFQVQDAPNAAEAQPRSTSQLDYDENVKAN